jgi:hypothetical protein
VLISCLPFSSARKTEALFLRNVAIFKNYTALKLRTPCHFHFRRILHLQPLFLMSAALPRTPAMLTILRVKKLGRIKCAMHVARKGEIRDSHKILAVILIGDHSWDSDSNSWIALKWNLQKQGVQRCTGLVWIKKESIYGLFRRLWRPHDFCEDMEFQFVGRLLAFHAEFSSKQLIINTLLKFGPVLFGILSK